MKAIAKESRCNVVPNIYFDCDILKSQAKCEEVKKTHMKKSAHIL